VRISFSSVSPEDTHRKGIPTRDNVKIYYFFVSNLIIEPSPIFFFFFFVVETCDIKNNHEQISITSFIIKPKISADSDGIYAFGDGY
jgi:hypothetical protein